ncbi:P-loop NTPase fold protein [Pseudoalteromonas sp. P1-25]|uniref:KAP family P-loop NTPase fold protein n=1 Tax=Pseudoalteromonas sp. P1-25 TaxID=1723758 RepID=UPI0006D65410|nr:P-loop NTPase fold protein [Pseudoalteromonas sp. P1-25]KPZ58252.1 KAP family P-loop domain protein [Pseudoalteromonas sp. P1-25]
MDISNYASKFNQWKDTYNWDTCKTNRKEFGQFIAQFLTSESRVVNLNGIYGSGKTEFIRRLYIELARRKHPVVYIDVWESDFSNNPLAVICSELLQQIEYVFKEKGLNGRASDIGKAKNIFNKLKSKLGTCLKYAEPATAFTGDPSLISGVKAISKVVEVTPDLNDSSQLQKYTEEVQKNHISTIQAVKEIKEYITYLSELIEIIYELNIPIVILIDELDRCRPNYAVEVLEVIKHFFETKGCTFLVATNTEVLEHSVKSIYGIDFDAQLYLRRFFDQKITLPQVSILKYLASKNLNFDKYKDKNILLYPFIDDQLLNLSMFANLFESNKIELRGIEQILDRFFMSLNYVVSQQKSSETIINTVVLILGLIEQHLGKIEQVERKNSGKAVFSVAISGSIKNLIQDMFNCVTITKALKCHSTGGRTSTFVSPQTILNIQSNNFSKVESINQQNLESVIGKAISYYENDSSNYWMWEDYQRIIQLAGHIE